MPTKSDPAYEAMRARDRDAWRTTDEAQLSNPDAPQVRRARGAAAIEIDEARRALRRYVDTDGLLYDSATGSFPTAQETRLAVEVAVAAKAMAEKTAALQGVLELHSAAIIAIERAQAELESARKALAEAEQKRGDMKTSSGHATVQSLASASDEFRAGYRAGADFQAGLAAGKRALRSGR